MNKLSFLLFITALLWSSCYQEEVPETVTVQGLKPIYIEESSVGTALSEAPKAFDNLGKIVTRGSFIYINEKTRGIHVIDNTVPTNPVTRHFWAIPGNIDFTIKENLLYADNGFDLMTIDIKQPDEIQLVHTIEDFTGYDTDSAFPAGYSGFFECVDRSKGAVLDWEEATLTDPKCRR